MKRFLGCLLAALLALSLCACAESAQAGKATVTVDQSALYARVGEEVTLPAATAADADGKDCSASVSVTVTFGGSTVFSGKGNAENTFTPTQEGGLYRKLLRRGRGERALRYLHGQHSGER